MTTQKTSYLESYKGFAIFRKSPETIGREYGLFMVANSDITAVIGLEPIKKEIDFQLSLTDKVVGSYRGFNIIRTWQNVEIIKRNGEEMVDNGFYYKIDHPVFGLLYRDMNSVKDNIDSVALDRDDFYKNHFYPQWKSFCNQLAF